MYTYFINYICDADFVRILTTNKQNYMCIYIVYNCVHNHCVITNRCNLSSFIALVNKGNCLFSTGQYDKARDYYQEALRFALLLQCINACS